MNDYFNYIEFLYDIREREEIDLDELDEIETYPFEAFWKSAIMGIIVFY